MSFFPALLFLLSGGMYLTLFRIPYWEIGSRFFKFITYTCLIGWALTLLMIHPQTFTGWLFFMLLLVLIWTGFSHIWAIKTSRHTARSTAYWSGFVLVLWILLALAIWTPGLKFFSYQAAVTSYFLQFTLSAGILGGIVNAMICGHWYLVNKYLSLTPIREISRAITILILAKIAVLGAVLLYVQQTDFYLFQTLVYSFPVLFWVRILAGLAGGLLLNWMSWKSLEYDNTQAATGILYGCITFIIMGEFSAFYLTIRLGVPL